MNDNQILQFTPETEGAVLARGAWWFTRAFALLFSAITTAAFFYRYAGGAFDFVFGAWSPYITAVAGAITLDGLSVTWGYIRGRNATTVAQMAVAQFMSYGNLVMSGVVTFVYLMLNSAFNVGVVDAAGNLTAWGYWLNAAGVFVLVVGVVANFVAAHLFADRSDGNRMAVSQAQIAALSADGRHHANQALAQAVTQRTIRDILAQLPDAASRQAAHDSGIFILGNLPAAADPQETRTEPAKITPPANGVNPTRPRSQS